MSNIIFEKVSPSYAKLTLQISKEEIENKLKSELTKAQKTANLRGFRKGKVPMATMYKIFGNQALMSYLDNEVDTSLKTYIEENKIEAIFAPFPAEDHEPEAIDIKSIKDLSLKYDLLLSPKIELDMPSKVFERYAVIPEESLLQEHIERIRKDYGESLELEEGEIEDNDLIEVVFTEMKDGEILEDGITNDTTLHLSSLNEKLQTELKGQAVGYTTTVDIFEVEEDASPKFVCENLLEVEEDESFEPTFELEVLGIRRLILAEMDEAFFLRYDDSGEINSEEKLKNFLADDFKAHFEKEALKMLKVRVREEVIQHMEIPLEEAVFKRVYEGSEENYPQFLKSIRWLVIQNNFVEANGIEPKEEDFLIAVRKRLAKMLGGTIPPWMSDDVTRNFMNTIIQDPKEQGELLEEVITELVLDRMLEQIQAETKEINRDEFDEIVEAFNEEFAPQNTEEEE